MQVFLHQQIFGSLSLNNGAIDPPLDGPGWGGRPPVEGFWLKQEENEAPGVLGMASAWPWQEVSGEPPSGSDL